MAVGLSSGFALKVAVFRASLALRGEMIGDDALYSPDACESPPGDRSGDRGGDAFNTVGDSKALGSSSTGVAGGTPRRWSAGGGAARDMVLVGSLLLCGQLDSLMME